MTKTTQINTKLAKVKEILTRLPETRDNDRELIAAYWRHEDQLLGFKSAETLLRDFLNGKLANPDDITRARRKLQAAYPELRGEHWTQQQRAVNEVDVRENINKDAP